MRNFLSQHRQAAQGAQEKKESLPRAQTPEIGKLQAQQQSQDGAWQDGRCRAEHSGSGLLRLRGEDNARAGV